MIWSAPRFLSVWSSTTLLVSTFPWFEAITAERAGAFCFLEADCFPGWSNIEFQPLLHEHVFLLRIQIVDACACFL